MRYIFFFEHPKGIIGKLAFQEILLRINLEKNKLRIKKLVRGKCENIIDMHSYKIQNILI